MVEKRKKEPGCPLCDSCAMCQRREGKRDICQWTGEKMTASDKPLIMCDGFKKV